MTSRRFFQRFLKSTVPLWALLALTLGSFSGCGKGGARVMSQAEAPHVEVTTVQKEDVQLYLIATGNTLPYEEVEVVARVSGYLEKILFEPGKIVSEGDPLFRIEQDAYLIALQSAEAELEVQQSRETLARANLERAKDLFEKETIPKEEYETRVAEYKIALANIENCKAAVEQAKLNLSYTDIKAPIGGKTDKKHVDVGNYVGQGGAPTHLVTVSRLDPILIDFQISDTEFNRYNQATNFIRDLKLSRSRPVIDRTEIMASKPVFTQVAAKIASDAETANTTTIPGAPVADAVPEILKVGTATEAPAETGTERRVEVDADKEYPFEAAWLSIRHAKEKDYIYKGKLTSISENWIDFKTGQIMIRGEIANPDFAIFPGQIVSVRIPVETITEAVLVHEEAIMTDLDMKYVILVEDGEYERPKTDPETGVVIRKDDGAPIMETVQGKMARRRSIKLGQQVGNGMRIVTEGLSGGETYIIKGMLKTRFDAPVEIVTSGAPATPAESAN